MTSTAPSRTLFAARATVVILGIALGPSLYGPAQASEAEAGARDRETRESRGAAPAPRRPPIDRSDGAISFPKAPLPSGSLRTPREDTRSLDGLLGPVPKEIVVAEGTSLEAMQRLLDVPNTRLGFALWRGNTLVPEDVQRLSRLPAVRLYFQSPLEPVHVEVAENVRCRRSAVVVVPSDQHPPESLGWRLARMGATQRMVLLEGEPSVERLALLAAIPAVTVGIRLPAGGLEEEQRAALAPMRRGIQVVVPASADPAAVRDLRDLPPESLLLETEGNRLRAEILEAAVATGARLVVEMDGGLSHSDLVELKGTPRLEILVRVDDSPGVPEGLAELLEASEGLPQAVERTEEEERSPIR